MKLTVFTDLDDTLFSSQTTVKDYPATVDRKGNYHAFSSHAQHHLLSIFASASADVIPVTGRNSESLARCQIEVIDNAKYSIVSHGMMILDAKKSPLPSWIAHLEAQYDLVHWCNEIQTALTTLKQDLEEIEKFIVIKEVSEINSISYISLKIKRKHNNETVKTQLKNYFKAAKFNNFTVHSNNRDFALLPPYCSKEKAVSYLYQKLKLNDNGVVFSIGDSMTDLGFMKRADFMIIPTHSQISEAMHD